jgi:hypothetical protein
MGVSSVLYISAKAARANSALSVAITQSSLRGHQHIEARLARGLTRTFQKWLKMGSVCSEAKIPKSELSIGTRDEGSKLG